MAIVREGLDDLDALKATTKIFIEGNHCLTEDHRILTATGWKSVDAISIGEEVATRDAHGLLEWQPIERIIRRTTDLDEQLFTLTTPSRTSISCTGQHNIIGHSNGVHWRRPAQECADTFDLISSVPSGQAEYPLTDNELELAAWASTDVHYATKHSGVAFYQSATGKEVRLRQVLEANGLHFTETIRDRDIRRVAGKVLKKRPYVAHEFHTSAVSGVRVRQLTGLTRKGRLPAWVMHLSDRQWTVFLDTLLAADGTRVSTGTAVVFYGEQPICEDVQIAAILHGWRASITEYRDRQFRVNLTPRRMIRVQGWKAAAVIAPPHTPVWCVTVPNGNFFTERDGCVHLTGNCDRLRRYLQDKAPALFGTVTIPGVLGLKERGWSFVPYKSSTKLGKLHITHDVGNAGRYAAFKALDTFQHSVITGHSHRLSYVVEGNAVGEHKLSAQLGWLGDVEQIDYMHKVNARKNWALGFGVGYVDIGSGCVYLTPVPIIKYTCVVNGKLYRG